MGYSLGGRVIDLFDDPGLKLLAGSPYLDKVSSLPVGDPDKLVDLDDHQFGVIFITKKGEAIRKYPLNDLTNAVLSNVYFDLAHQQLPPEAKVAAATRIKAACCMLGVDCTPAVEKFAADELPEGRNYVRLDKVAGAAGEPIDLFKQLHDAYVENREKYGRDAKVELAQAMKEAGAKFGFSVHDDLKPFVIDDPVIDKEALFSQCALRKNLTQAEASAIGLMDEFLDKHADFDPKETVKLLETFDRQFGLDAYWGRGLEPYGILTEKVASHNIPLANSRSMALTDEEIKSWVGSNGDLIGKMFGKDMAERVKKDPMSILSLPQASHDFVVAHIEHARENTPVEAK